MADSQQETDLMHTPGDPSVTSDTAGEPQDESNGKLSAPEQSASVDQEEQAKPEQGVEHDAMESATEGPSPGDGEAGTEIESSSLEQDSGVEHAGTRVSGSPELSATGQEDGLPTEEESGVVDRPSMASGSAAAEEGDSEAKDEEHTVMDADEVAIGDGANVKAEGDIAKDEGGDVKVEGDVEKNEGDIAKDEGDVAKDEGVSDPAREEEVWLSREEIIAHLREALATQEQLKALNAQYQHKIAEYLAKKKVCAPSAYVCTVGDWVGLS